MSIPEFQFGISSWSYPWAVGAATGPQPDTPLTALDLVKQADALNVNLVQIADNLPIEALSKADLQQLNDFARSRGIRIEVGTKGVEPEHLRRFLNIAQFLGSPVVRTLPAIFGKRISIKEAETQLRDVLDDYEKAGVVIVLENQEAFTAQEYADMMARVQHPHLQICLDLANALGAMEGPEHAMRLMGPHCGNFHFKDVTIIRSKTLMGFTIEGRPSGQGSIPIHWALGELQKYGKTPSVIIELWPPLQNSFEDTLKLEQDWVRQSVDFMRTLSWNP